MSKEVVFSDVDGTITTVRWGGPKYLLMILWWRKLTSLQRLGRFVKLVMVALRLVWGHWVTRTITFETMYKRIHAAVFRGLSVKECKEIASKHLQLPWRHSVLREIQQRNARKIAVTASVGDVYEDLLLRNGFDQVIGTTLEVKDGCYTGRVLRLINGEEKAAVVTSEGGVAHTAAYGDSKHDIPMLRASNEAIAVHPDQALANYVQQVNIPSRI